MTIATTIRSRGTSTCAKIVLGLLASTAMAPSAGAQGVDTTCNPGTPSFSYARPGSIQVDLANPFAFKVLLRNGGQMDQGYDANTGFVYSSTGGEGRKGESGGVTGRGHDGERGGKGGDIRVINCGTIHTVDPNVDGMYMRSVGGNGGQGGAGGAFDQRTGDGGEGGNGGAVTIEAVDGTSILTKGNGSNGIHAFSLGGNGGKGGSGVLWGGSGKGATGANGGNISIVAATGTSDWQIETQGSLAHGILARSEGGFAGAGGSGNVIASGGKGGTGGNSGSDIKVDSGARIRTSGNGSNAMTLESVGGQGGDGNGGTRLFVSLGASGGVGGNAGRIDVHNAGDLVTAGDDAKGIAAQTIGGGGGSGGDAFNIGALGGLAIGGSGGGGGDAGEIAIRNSANVTTSGHGSFGLFANSVGGGGGDGGHATGVTIGAGEAVQVSIGGSGGSGGNGHSVSIRQELGSVGSAISTGVLGSRPVPVAGVDQFVGDMATAMLAQSVGGGGGSGGRAIAVAASGTDAGPTVSVAVGIGGTGGNGGSGSDVTAFQDYETRIATYGRQADGMLAQSIGGGGGHGGSVITVAAAVGPIAGSISLGLGGSGGKGGNASSAFASAFGTIATSSDMSSGAIARSVGGGGGSGGNVIDVAASLARYAGSVAVGIGGHGGSGGTAATASMDARGVVTTLGNASHGVVAQSIGGGGGSGGNVHTYAVSASAGGGANGLAAAASVAVGGVGGSGGAGGYVKVQQGASISTSGDISDGVLAQSIGGGGGDGGNVFALSVAASLDKGGAGGTQGGRSLSAAVTVGGNGGVGGSAGAVDYQSSSGASITTSGVRSPGLVAQSIGGGGGNGGHAHSFAASSAIPVDQSRVLADKTDLLNKLSKIGIGGETKPADSDTKNGLNASVAVGGKGGSGNVAGKVSLLLDPSTTISTAQAQSHGIMAQSIGGGGGSGGFAFSDGFAGVDAFGVNIAIGAAGGTGARADTVMVRSISAFGTGRITTKGDQAHGILAQSIGAGGGEGGAATTDLWGVPRLSKNAAAVALGGSGGASGNGADVLVDYDQTISTSGAMASTIVAQSIGGGGGMGAATKAGGLLEFTLGGTGGATGNGGAVTVSGLGALATTGDVSHGLVAQSIGGGGGIGGSAGGATSIRDVGLKIHLGGDGSGGGSGGAVTVQREGTISTAGKSAFGILAQSVGGGGGLNALSEYTAIAGNVPIEVSTRAGNGNGGKVSVTTLQRLAISTTGDGSHAIFAQSAGGGGGLLIGNGDYRATADQSVPGGNSTGGDVNVGSNAEMRISTTGNGAHGIYAESVSLGITISNAIGSTGHLSVGAVGTGLVTVVQSGTIDTSGTESHGISVYNANSKSDRAFDVTVKGAVTVTGARSYGLLATNGLLPDATQNRANGFVTVAQGGSIKASGLDGGAIRLDNRLGTSNVTIEGSVDGGAGDAISSISGYSVKVQAGGSVTGRVTADSGGFVVSNQGVMRGGVGSDANPAYYALGTGGQHFLGVDPRNSAGGSDRLVASTIDEQGGTISAYLKSLPKSGYSVDRFITGARSLSMIRYDGVATFYDYSKAGGDVSVGNVTVDYTRGGFTGNDASLAGMANGLLADWTKATDAGQQARFGDFLLAAANASSAGQLSSMLETFDASNHYSSVDAAMLASSNHLNNMQSCGTTSGPYAAIAESECTWAKVVYTRTDRRDGDQRHDTTTWAIGQQREVSPDVFVGLNAAYEDADYTGVGSRSDGRRVYLGAIGKLSRGPLLASASAAVSYGWSDSRRDVRIVDSVAKSKQDTRTLTTRLRAAYLLETGALDVTPIVELDMALIDDEGYVEKGAGDFDLRVRAKTHFLADLRPAVRFGSETGIGTAVLRGYAETGARFALNDTTHKVSLANVPTSIGSAALALGRDEVVGTLAAGASINSSDRLEFSLRYEAGFGADTRSHSGSFKVGLKF